MTNDDMTQSTRDGSQFNRKDGELNREATRKGKITKDHGRTNRINRFGPISEYRDTVRIGHTALGKQLLPQFRREGSFRIMRNEGKNGWSHMQPRGKGPRMVHSSTPEREACGLQQELQAQTKCRQVRGIPCKKPPITRMESRVKVWVLGHRSQAGGIQKSQLLPTEGQRRFLGKDC